MSIKPARLFHEVGESWRASRPREDQLEVRPQNSPKNIWPQEELFQTVRDLVQHDRAPRSAVAAADFRRREEEVRFLG